MAGIGKDRADFGEARLQCSARLVGVVASIGECRLGLVLGDSLNPLCTGKGEAVLLHGNIPALVAVAQETHPEATITLIPGALGVADEVLDALARAALRLGGGDRPEESA